MPHAKHDAARFNNEIKVMDINLALFLRTHSKNQRIAHKAHRKFLVRGGPNYPWGTLFFWIVETGFNGGGTPYWGRFPPNPTHLQIRQPCPELRGMRSHSDIIVISEITTSNYYNVCSDWITISSY